MDLRIKNMVCSRCILAVQDILQNEAIPFQEVIIGLVRLQRELSPDERTRLVKRLEKIDFELVDDRSTALIERIKQLVIRRVRNANGDSNTKTKLSHHIAREVNYEYTYLSSLFSSAEGRTIENYFIEQRIERVKELLLYGQMTLSQIAFDLEYSSVAHLSAQFKKITGVTPSIFKEKGQAKRVSLDRI